MVNSGVSLRLQVVRSRSRGLLLFAAVWIFAVLAAGRLRADEPEFQPKKSDRIVIIGNTFAERMQHFGFFERRLQLGYPGLGLTVRNMGWSADEVDLMPRPLNFGELERHLGDQRPSIILMCFGANESFKGKAGLADFRKGLTGLLDRLEQKDFDGRAPARLILISPTAHEKLPPPFPHPRERNGMLAMYAAEMAKFAEQRGVLFIDLFQPSLSLMAEHPDIQFTINGIHFNERGYSIISEALANLLGVPSIAVSTTDAAPMDGKLAELIVQKNEHFFLRWRPINGEYVYGRRKEPFGVISYPPEMAELDRIIADLDKRIHVEASQQMSSESKPEAAKP